jgi:site-specific DNA recombinase
VWNRQRKDEVLLDLADVALGFTAKQRWNEPGAWIWSERPVHEPLIDVATFGRAQALRQAAAPGMAHWFRCEDLLALLVTTALE